VLFIGATNVLSFPRRLRERAPASSLLQSGGSCTCAGEHLLGKRWAVSTLSRPYCNLSYPHFSSFSGNEVSVALILCNRTSYMILPPCPSSERLCRIHEVALCLILQVVRCVPFNLLGLPSSQKTSARAVVRMKAVINRTALQMNFSGYMIGRVRQQHSASWELRVVLSTNSGSGVALDLRLRPIVPLQASGLKAIQHSLAFKFLTLCLSWQRNTWACRNNPLKTRQR
jgi:hypothetical protein